MVVKFLGMCTNFITFPSLLLIRSLSYLNTSLTPSINISKSCIHLAIANFGDHQSFSDRKAISAAICWDFEVFTWELEKKGDNNADMAVKPEDVSIYEVRQSKDSLNESICSWNSAWEWQKF